MNGFIKPHDLCDWSDERQGAVNHVRGEVSHRAVGHAARAPCGRCLGISIEIFGMFAAKPRDVADLALGDQLSRELAGGGADIVETYHVDHARCIGGGDHGGAVFERSAKRFLAKHRLAEGESRLGDLSMGFLRGRDDDGLDAGGVDQDPPVVGGAGESIFFAVAFGSVRAGGANHFQSRPEGGVEDRTHCGHGDRVRLTHVTATKNAYTDFSHEVLSPFSITVCNRLQT